MQETKVSETLHDIAEGKTYSQMVVIDALQYSNWDRRGLGQLRSGGLTAVHVTVAIWEDARATLDNIGQWYRRIRENGDLVIPIRTVDDILRAKEDGKTGIVLGFQNCSPFEDDLMLVEIFAQLGVKVAQLTYNIQNLVGSSCYETNDSGLTRYGEKLIHEMNRVGMLVDLSHVGERTSRDAIEESARPVAVTHANPSEFWRHPRNKSDGLLRALAARGGVLGCSPYPHVLGETHAAASDWAAAVAHAADVMGAEHVGIGTDSSFAWADSHLGWIRNGRWTFDDDRGASLTGDPGWPTWPEFFRSPADFPNLFSALSAKGFSEMEVAGILGRNWLRLFGQVFNPLG